MTCKGSLIAAACLALTAPGGAALAQQPTHTAAHARCCHVPAGTVVAVELAEPVSTKTHKTGDTFAIRLAQPVVVQGQVVLRAGTAGIGTVIQASKPGLGGKGAKLVLAARSLTGPGGVDLPLKGLQLAGSGKGNGAAATAVGAAGIAFAPLGVAAFAIRGGDMTFPVGAQANAKLVNAATLPSLGHAPRDAVHASTATPAIEAGPISLPGPAKGQGEIVFFRKKSILGTGQWFNVRENGQALGKLTNGAYFVESLEPGLHTFTASTEPEFKDQLTMQVDAGETYFVEGVLNKGVVIGAAGLTPSDRTSFNAAATDLKAAEEAEDEAKQATQEKAARQPR